MKNKIKILGGSGVLLGIAISRILSSNFGKDGQIALVTGITIVSGIIILIFVFTKYYLIALGLFSIVLPIVVMLVGMKLDNLYLIIGSLIFLVILLQIDNKFLLPIIKNKNKK